MRPFDTQNIFIAYTHTLLFFANTFENLVGFFNEDYGMSCFQFFIFYTSILSLFRWKLAMDEPPRRTSVLYIPFGSHSKRPLRDREIVKLRPGQFTLFFITTYETFIHLTGLSKQVFSHIHTKGCVNTTMSPGDFVGGRRPLGEREKRWWWQTARLF